MSAFSQRLEVFLDEYFRLQPVEATSAGDHDHDGSWPDLTEDGRAARLEFVERWTAELESTAVAGLSAGERLDREVVLLELKAEQFAETELREDRWDPLGYVYLLGAGLFPLVAREFAPLGSRLASVARRLEGIPGVLAAARANLGGPTGRSVSQLHLDTALRQLDGVVALANEAVAAARAGAPIDPEIAAIAGRLEDAGRTAEAAIEDFRSFLQTELRPSSEGEGRLGRELFDRKLRHALRGGLSSDEILARAEHEYAAIRAEMVRLAGELWPTWIPDRQPPELESAADRPAAEAELVGAVLGAIGAVHRQSDELLDYCRGELARIESFIRSVDLVTPAEEPLELIWTPEFLRSSAGAMLVPPGPLDADQKSFFCITPPPDDWTPEQIESNLREDNDRMLRLLTIHEAVPGHYLQLSHANHSGSLVRSVFHDGTFIEGWAVYATQVMIDRGYGSDDPALLLTHWKFYLRSVINAILDVRIHRGEMTEDEAVSLMVEGGFQEESEARAKWNRARLTSTQLCTYFVGSTELWQLERERRRQLTERAGAGAEAVPEPTLVGGFGETPGFRYRDHLDSLLAHGSPPISVLRSAILGE